MSNWDKEIDEAAREMTRGEPDAGFKARVLSRIDALDEPRPMWRSPWIVSPLAAAAVAVFAVMVMRGPESPSRDGTEVRLRPDAFGRRPGPADPASPAGPTGPALRDGEGQTAVVALMRAETVATIARNDDMESIAPALLEIEPLGTEAIETMESIEITRLEVTALDVPLLSAQQ